MESSKTTGLRHSGVAFGLLSTLPKIVPQLELQLKDK